MKQGEGMPSCTCKDWLRHQLPYKHFFAIFRHRKEWQWEQLPSEYLQSAYLSMDVDSIHRHFQQSSEPTVCNYATHDCMDTTEDVVGGLPLRVSVIIEPDCRGVSPRACMHNAHTHTAHTYTHAHTCTHKHTDTYPHAHNTCTHEHTHAHTHIHIRAHTYTVKYHW